MPKQTQQANRLLFRDDDGQEVPYIAPKNKQQLQYWFYLLFGMIISDKACCPDHQAPLDALAAAYFADAPVVVWKASRGLGGKSTMLAGLSILELLDGADVNVLGGSGRQSQRVHEVEKDAWNHTIILEDYTCESPLKQFIPNEPTSWSTQTIWGNKLLALTASTKSARGPHPQRLRMDEVDEMKWEVYNAAMGQSMSRKGIKAQTVLSSTQQYPDGTMSKVLKLAKERGWPVFEWCYKETSVENGGWLEPQEVTDKKNSVTEVMWLIEYELQEPSYEGRIFTAEALLKTFKQQIGMVQDKMGAYYEFEKPREDAKYATGADWAKEQDYTVISTIRYDISPARLVAFERVQLEPYPLMIARLDRRLIRYPGKGIHDASGIGSVISDYIDANDVVPYQTKRKPELYSDYIIAVEGGKIEAPMIASMHSEHKYAKTADIYSTEGHPPDTMASMALAWQAVIGRPTGKKKPGRLGRPIRV